MRKEEQVKKWIEDHLNAKVADITKAADGFFNEVFIVQVNEKRAAVRLCRQQDRTEQELEAEMQWLDHLSSCGIAVAKSYKTTGDRSVFPFTYNGESYWLCFFEHTEGQPVDVLDTTVWNESLFHEWGKQLASLHCVDKLDIQGRSSGFEKLQQMKLEEEWLRYAFQRLMQQMSGWEQNEEVYGFIHHDLHQGNFHIREGKLIFFDFDDCGNHFYAQDIAVSIYHALWTGTSFHPDWDDFPSVFLHSFLSGYTSKKTLSRIVMEQVLVSMHMREVFLYSLFKNTWDMESLEDWQKWKLNELETNIRNNKIPFKSMMEESLYLFG
ncbi:phosphotransferase enzyme family protein [Sporosarcina cyprini]|uniref:phosphotransferase enzyme family protein n=1 Tax=Sporosarcina cyprini TaxID=2910523 RepID=UPI001EDD5730|nr:phosphotransferase [Sporosarcina cyprini]MCG3089352.1 phosphotransferase [Sporosarcina cyprini]